MKKGYIFLVLFMLSLIYMSLTVNSAVSIEDTGQYITAFKNDNLLRLHVVANSNSPQDQFIKRKIRDDVINNLSTLKKDYSKKDIILKVNSIVERTLLEHEIDYLGISNIGKFLFPRRTYANLTLPAGKYKALKIELGKAEGANWWCVLFPPLCLETELVTEKKQVNSNDNMGIKKVKIKLKLAKIFKLERLKDFELNIHNDSNKIKNIDFLKFSINKAKIF
jgi:stage II sporulation protein R